MLADTGHLPDASMECGRSRQRLVVHHATILLRPLRHWSQRAVTIESAMVGRGLGRGVDGAGPLVDGSTPHTGHAASHPHAATPPSPVNGGQWHVGILILNLTNSK